MGERLRRPGFGGQVDDLGGTERPKDSVPIGRMSDIAGEQPRRRWQVDGLISGVRLWVRRIHHCDVVAGCHQTMRERGPNKTRSASDKHGS